MAHKTLINGTAYEIKGGKTLVNGTAYEIKGGKTLVGGTAYGIPFVKIVNVTLVYSKISSAVSPLVMMVTIDGTEYKNEIEVMSLKPKDPKELQVLTGIISCRGTLQYYYQYSGAKIIVNGETVAEAQKPTNIVSFGEIAYDYSLRGNVQIAWSIADNWEILTITEV